MKEIDIQFGLYGYAAHGPNQGVVCVRRSRGFDDKRFDWFESGSTDLQKASTVWSAKSTDRKLWLTKVRGGRVNTRPVVRRQIKMEAPLGFEVGAKVMEFLKNEWPRLKIMSEDFECLEEDPLFFWCERSAVTFGAGLQLDVGLPAGADTAQVERSFVGAVERLGRESSITFCVPGLSDGVSCEFRSRRERLDMDELDQRLLSLGSKGRSRAEVRRRGADDQASGTDDGVANGITEVVEGDVVGIYNEGKEEAGTEPLRGEHEDARRMAEKQLEAEFSNYEDVVAQWIEGVSATFRWRRLLGHRARRIRISKYLLEMNRRVRWRLHSAGYPLDCVIFFGGFLKYHETQGSADADEFKEATLRIFRDRGDKILMLLSSFRACVRGVDGISVEYWEAVRKYVEEVFSVLARAALSEELMPSGKPEP